jgi:hypothetical protein
MSIETTALYRAMRSRPPPSATPDLMDKFDALREVIQEHAKYIVLVFPEYTPHDHTRHLDHLFILADRVLGPTLYNRLNASELALFGFGLYAHDWGMAVSSGERKCLTAGINCDRYDLVQGEPKTAQAQVNTAVDDGASPEISTSRLLAANSRVT